MKLTIKDRYVLLQLLPASGTFSTIRAIDKTRKVLLPNDEEVTRYQIVATEQQVKWDAAGDKDETEIAIPSAGFDIIKTQFKKLDDEGKLMLGWTDTLEKLDAAIEAPK